MTETRRIDTRIPAELDDQLKAMLADSFWGSKRATVEHALRLYLKVRREADKGLMWAVDLLAEANA